MVTARELGPAWWWSPARLPSHPGPAETDVPPGLTWDTSVLDRRLKSASALIGGSIAVHLDLSDARSSTACTG